MADELFDLRNTVTLGNFHQAIAEGSQIRASGRQADEIVDIHAERDLLVARAQVGLGQWDAVIAEQRNASHPLLKCAFAWASFNKALRSSHSSSSGNNSKKDEPEIANAIKILEGVAGDTPKIGVPATAATMLAACYFHLASADDEHASSSLNAGLHLGGSWVAALSKQIVPTSPPSNVLVRHILELRAVCVEGLLRLSRVDLADRMLQEMRTLDDDAVITMLAGVSVALAQAAQIGGAPLSSGNNNSNVNDHESKANEALSIIQDLSARCGQSTSLLNIAAVASLLAGKSSDCESSLVASLGKRSTDVDTLSNLAALAANLSKPVESYNRLVGQANNSDSNGAWTKQYAAAQLRFREAASSFAASQ